MEMSVPLAWVLREIFPLPEVVIAALPLVFELNEVPDQVDGLVTLTFADEFVVTVEVKLLAALNEYGPVLIATPPAGAVQDVPSNKQPGPVPPVVPDAPVAPLAPVRPYAPVAPLAPVRPVAPVAPLAP